MREMRKQLVNSILPVFILGCLVAYALDNLHPANTAVTIDPASLFTVSRVIDGDTIRAIYGKKEITVRLLGIDAPETVDPRKPVGCFGNEASKELKDILRGRNVRLELNPEREVTDKYARYLAYVYRDDGLFVNEYLIVNGFAREYTYGSAYSLQKRFKAAEKQARGHGNGLWKKCFGAAGHNS
ncbi:MAG: micrococcal nuclease [Candidatus Parcubacteria bacterium]|jgi:micrococcal nuclease|nr:micrococcal nuclease [Candidatus Parcubacteria bacterium]